MFQTTLRLHVSDRYAAHVEVDKIYKNRDRIDRDWHHAILDAGPAGFWTLLRTSQNELVQASPRPDAWSSLADSPPGEEVSFVVQYAPKKVTHFSRFFEDDEIAIEHVRSRLGMLDQLVVDLISRQHINISKRAIAYSAPSGFFRVSGSVRDPHAYAEFLRIGIGGSRAFGLGLAITPDSPLYELALALAEAEV